MPLGIDAQRIRPRSVVFQQAQVSFLFHGAQRCHGTGRASLPSRNAEQRRVHCPPSAQRMPE